MKQLIFNDICFKLDDLCIPYTQDDKYIRVSTVFFDVGVDIQPKKVFYDLSVLVDETNRSVSMVVKTSDEYLLASGNGSASASTGSIFRKVRHISYRDGQSIITVIDLGDVPNTVKNTAVKYGWKFRTALNLNKQAKKATSVRTVPETADEIVPEPVQALEPEPVQTPPVQECPATPIASESSAANTAAPNEKVGIIGRLFGNKKYKSRH